MGTSSECPKCDSKGLEEIGYRRLRCPRCDFEGDRDVIGKLNIRKRALKMLGISGGSLTTPTAPPDDRNPNRWGEPMIRPEGNPRPLGRGGGQQRLCPNIIIRDIQRPRKSMVGLNSQSTKKVNWW
jgi:hypothetical protein